MKPRWKYCKHCRWCSVHSRKKATFACMLNGMPKKRPQLCPIYHAKTHEEALAALVLRRLENGT